MNECTFMQSRHETLRFYESQCGKNFYNNQLPFVYIRE